jgi:phosphate transport system permease protein
MQRSPDTSIAPSRKQTDVVWNIGVWSCALIVVGMFLLIAGDVLWRGISGVNWEFLTSLPEHSGREGGIRPVIVSTLFILAVCLSAAVPLGVMTAMFLSEMTARKGRLGRTIRISLDILAGVPSIVFGLFGNAFFCIVLGMGFSILSGGLTLACMALPLIIRASEEGFRAIPDSQRLTAAALGMSRTSTLFRILLPAAWPGVLMGVVLGIGRALAETAALIFTSGYVLRMPRSLFDSGRSLSVHIYDLAMNVPGGEANAYSSALVLMVLIVAVNVVAGLIARFWLARNLISTTSRERRLS